jgi:hypothetical protein
MSQPARAGTNTFAAGTDRLGRRVGLVGSAVMQRTSSHRNLGPEPNAWCR